MLAHTFAKLLYALLMYVVERIAAQMNGTIAMPFAHGCLHCDINRMLNARRFFSSLENLFLLECTMAAATSKYTELCVLNVWTRIAMQIVSLHVKACLWPISIALTELNCCYSTRWDIVTHQLYEIHHFSDFPLSCQSTFAKVSSVDVDGISSRVALPHVLVCEQRNEMRVKKKCI